MIGAIDPYEEKADKQRQAKANRRNEVFFFYSTATLRKEVESDSTDRSIESNCSKDADETVCRKRPTICQFSFVDGAL